ETNATENSYIFRSQKGNNLSTVQVWRIIKKPAKKAKIKGADRVSPHFMRHSHISHALDRGAPLHLVRDTAGHSSIATTNRYAHIKPNESSSDYLIL
ncbi:MAG: tyrosine-type recombinase/integrase, partial [Halanaerobiales bacterium]